MPAAVAVPLIAAGVGAGATIVASRTAQGAQRDAARIENDAALRALDYQREQDAYERKRQEEETAYDRQQFADYQGRLAPFRNAGTSVLPGLTQRVSGAATAAVPTNGGGTGMVTLKAPTGAMREVPASQADYYIAQGAVRVD